MPAAVGTRILLETTFATWRFTAIRGLLSIGAFEQLAAGPLTTTELADRCGANAEILRRVLRCVAATGLLRWPALQRHELFYVCRRRWRMASAAAGSTPTLDVDCAWRDPDDDPHLQGTAHRQNLQSGCASSDAAADSRWFDPPVTGNYAQVASALAQAVDFAKLGTVADVGGGHGGFITAILRAHPSVRGILTELGRALPGARDHLAANGVADRCDVTACDFFTDPLPSGAGAYLLGHVIHNWNDEQALAILRAVRAAIPDDSQLLLVEAIIPDHDAPHLAKDLDIRVITMLPGGERTESEYAQLLTEAGFRPQPAVHLARIESVIAATPAGGHACAWHSP